MVQCLGNGLGHGDDGEWIIQIYNIPMGSMLICTMDNNMDGMEIWW
jgi:hypothetical protein